MRVALRDGIRHSAMKLEYFFFALFGLLLAATGMLAMHYRGELMAERRINELTRQAPAVPAASLAAPAAPPTAAPAVDQAALDRAALQRQLEQAETEKNLLASRVEAMTAPEAGGAQASAGGAGADAAGAGAAAEPAGAGLSDSQRRIQEAPAIATVQQYLPDQGFAVIDAGSARGLKTGQVYAVRRGPYIIAKKVEVGETVEESQAVIGVNASALQPGESLKPGDEVIKWD